MLSGKTNEPNNEKTLSPASGIMTLFIFVFFGFLIAQIVSAILVLPFVIDFNNPTEIMDKMNNITAYPEMRFPLMLIQGISAIITFIVVPLFYIKIYKISYHELTGWGKPIHPLALTAIIIMVLAVFPLLSMVYEWNMGWQFPDAFHQWAATQEEQMKIMTEFLLVMDNPIDLIIALLVIAIIPGIGEELLFRGLIQTQLSFAIKNMHIVIWLTAFIFAAIHMQFFGLIPRMLLGAIFGYIFYWSGSIKYAMVAHAVNNGFQVIVTYIMAQSDSEFNLDEQTSFPIYITVISIFITSAILYYLHTIFQKNEVANDL